MAPRGRPDVFIVKEREKKKHLKDSKQSGIRLERWLLKSDGSKRMNYPTFDFESKIRL